MPRHVEFSATNANSLLIDEVMANAFLRAAALVDLKKRQSIKGATFLALQESGNIPYYGHCTRFLTTLYGREWDLGYIYHGGFGKGFWLAEGQRGQMVDALLFAHHYVRSEMLLDPTYDRSSECSS